MPFGCKTIFLGDSTPTIELELQNALFKVGCIQESNFGDLSKIHWSRSSRTDKGVHSARTIITAKFEITTDILQSSIDGRMKRIVDLLNENLPLDIRVFSMVKVNQAFVAKTSCHWREYEYLLPMKCVATNENLASASPEELLNRLNKSLRKFEGSHSYHNYHRLSTKDLLAKKIKKQTKFILKGDENDENDKEIDEENDKIIEDSDDSKDEVAVSSEGLQFADYESKYYEILKSNKESESEDNRLKVRILAPRTFNTIYICEAMEIVDVGNDKFIRIIVLGKSFLLHQIRLMIGAATLECRGVIPDFSINLSLLAPIQMAFVMAPAEGLVLLSAGISTYQYANRINFSLSRYTKGYRNEFPLLTDEEYLASEKFKIDNIYPKIAEDWKALVTSRASSVEPGIEIPIPKVKLIISEIFLLISCTLMNSH